MSFVHLHVHSEFSLLQSAAKIADIVSLAAELNFPAVALTDINAMHGVIPFYKACKEKGIKPIIGVELHYNEKELSGREGPKYSLLFLAKSNKGYRSLLTLTTLAQTRENKQYPYITYSDLEKHAVDIIIISPFETGEMQFLLQNGQKAEANQVLDNLRKIVVEQDVYVEIQNHWRREERERLLAIREWQLERTIPIVASNHVHFLKKEQKDAHRVLNAIRLGEKLDTLPAGVTSEEYTFKSQQEMKELLPSWENAINETEKISERCEVTIALGEPVLPEFPVPQGFTSHTFLKHLCDLGVKERFQDPQENVWQRLAYELEVISTMNYEDYFLIVADFMKYAHDNHILTGPGRGSAAGSIVAYVLKITNVDPLEHDLLFERFLNPERVSMPDIDIDFSDTQRDEVIQYVAGKYGKTHVSQIVTFGTLAAKAALRDSARVLDLQQNKIDRVAKLIPSKSHITLRQAIAETPALKDMIAGDEELITLFRIAENIEGLPRHTSIHAAGVVMSKEPLTNVVPLQQGNDGLYLTQYPMGDLEEIGLLKMDFLGLRNLSFIERIIQLVFSNKGMKIELDHLPWNDKKTFDLLSEGDTSGIFQLESAGMKRVLKGLKPSEFEDIVAVNALYRPGPMENIPLYIARKHGEKSVSYPHEDLKGILKSTYGVVIYQEQIMKIASLMAGFTLAEADVLRRAVGKKKKEILEETREQFVRGASKKNYSLEEAEKVYDLIVRFADYGFNRSHAVAYSMISYQLAYLKANHSQEFLSSLMDMSIHNQEKLSEYISEARRKNITVMGPSILHSGALFEVKQGAIFIGLAALKNLGLQAIKNIIEERRNGPFKNLFDLCSRVSGKTLSRKALESLVFAGALDDFGVERASQLASLDDAMEFGEKEREKQLQRQDLLFYEEDSNPTYTEVSPLSNKDHLRYEKEVLGFYASGHPVQDAEKLLHNYDRLKILQIKEKDIWKDRESVRLAGLVENIRVIQTKKKEQMAFVRLSDETGEIEMTVFPKAFREFDTKLQKEELVFIEGKIQEHQGERKVLVDKCTTVEALQKRDSERKKPVLFLNITLIHERDGTLEKLKELLQDTPGSVPVILKYESNGQAIRLSEMWNTSSKQEFIYKIQAVLGQKNVFLKNP
ncbi:DNA polymerase III subunit alpha [Salipaludibacillus neizhouensis]|uniref:DNA polymerase III subunit alpha n=1 Tax=Salipaludibacillus neizhouensis TaxID=885475 RepID=A0A3A9K8K8_9BACI|nr:DNA polymerase III subunit alpha [Salipaludibacillus neizhouensis]RKL66711.1 DNA polymerase III subunit alpha [Salipaludibacillus neizhouensis]